MKTLLRTFKPDLFALAVILLGAVLGVAPAQAASYLNRYPICKKCGLGTAWLNYFSSVNADCGTYDHLYSVEGWACREPELGALNIVWLIFARRYRLGIRWDRA